SESILHVESVQNYPSSRPVVARDGDNVRKTSMDVSWQCKWYTILVASKLRLQAPGMVAIRIRKIAQPNVSKRAANGGATIYGSLAIKGKRECIGREKKKKE
ncbi:hypothetical protein PanWU01x14_352330, partial [Parasponia andersonii]